MKRMDTVVSFEGKQINDMSKEQLIEVINKLADINTKLGSDHTDRIEELNAEGLYWEI